MKVIIFGTGDCAKLAKFYLDNDSKYKPIAFTEDKNYIKEKMIDGIPVMPFEEINADNTNSYFFAPLYSNQLRKKKSEEIKQKGFKLISYISSKAVCFGKVGENCFIMEQNTIQPFVEIGNNVIMWSGNHIGHHSLVKDNVFISSHVVISGHCEINEFCWLGVNSTVKENTILAKGTFVAMSAAICKNTLENKIYMGIPAKEKQEHDTTKKK